MSVVLVYWIAKIYFMAVLPLFYIYVLLTGQHSDALLHITGVVALLFLLSNLLWYFGGRAGR